MAMLGWSEVELEWPQHGAAAVAGALRSTTQQTDKGFMHTIGHSDHQQEVLG